MQILKSKSSGSGANSHSNGPGNRRREFIYASERIKAIRAERNALMDERDTLKTAPESDEARRRSIYVNDHLQRLALENEEQLEMRASLAAELKL